MKTEILSPAGSPQAAKCAVLSGADAIYMGTNNFNARKNAKNFSNQEILETIEFCHERDVKVYIVLNTLLNDREFPILAQEIEFINTSGADAVIVQDLALARFIKKTCPNLPIHASTQMTINNLQGALFAKSLGFTRVVLSRELSIAQIEYITKNAGIETEVFVHGALCMSYSGACYMSSVIGQRSGNRGLCAQPCRLPFSRDGQDESKLLSLKDLSLANYIVYMKNIGVSSLKIEGRMKRAEYSGAVTKIYSDILREERESTQEEREILEKVFSRTGFTDGYAKSDIGEHMFGEKTEYSDAEEIYKQYRNLKDFPKIPLKISFKAIKNQAISIKIEDNCGNTVKCDGNESQIAINKATTKEQIKVLLCKMGGTPYYVENMNIISDSDIMIPAKDINAIRRCAIEKLAEFRKIKQNREFLPYKYPEKIKNQKFSGYTVSVLKFNQISQCMIDNAKDIYVPLFEIIENLEKAKIIKNIVCIIPKIYNDDEMQQVKNALTTIKNEKINKVLCTNVSSITLAREFEFEMIGDYSLNIFSSVGLETIKDIGISRQTLSFELMFSQIRDINKILDTEILIYGRLSLMIFENCRIKDKTCTCEEKQSYLFDRRGEKFPLIPEFGCRNTLLNGKILNVSDDYKNIGIKYARLVFTIETKEQCQEIFQNVIYSKNITKNTQNDTTKGLYYRGVI